jgi:hypothetical protein
MAPLRRSKYCLAKMGELGYAETPYTPGGCIAQRWRVARLPGAILGLRGSFGEVSDGI